MKKLLLIIISILVLCCVLISCDRGKEIDSLEIVDGELIIYYTNGTSQNLGKIEGEDDFKYYPLSDGTYAISVEKAIMLSEIEIPSTYRGKAVTQIKESGFKNATNLKKLTIPSSITRIDKSAFALCSSLTEVHIDSIEAWCNVEFENELSNPLKIAQNLYVNNQLLTSLTIPNTITEIKDYAFYNCDSLIDVTIPQNVTSIGEYAFSGCNGLKNITIGNGVTSIGEYAFSACDSLVDLLIIGNNVTSIGNFAFSHCRSLTDVTIPDCVISIGENAFSDCYSLTNVIIGNGVTSIGEYAFSLCNSLTSVTIGDNVKSIGDHAFYYCRSLKSIRIPEGVTIIDSAFVGCDSLESVTFENTNGWYVTRTKGATSGTNMDVTNVKTNATYFTGLYSYYYWYRKD